MILIYETISILKWIVNFVTSIYLSKNTTIKIVYTWYLCLRKKSMLIVNVYKQYKKNVSSNVSKPFL